MHQGRRAMLHMILTLAFACGRDHGHKSSPRPDDTKHEADASRIELTELEKNPSLLVGIWDSPCLLSKINDDLYERVSLNFLGDKRFIRERRIFEDDDCQTSVAIETMHGQYSLNLARHNHRDVHTLVQKVISLAIKTNSDTGGALFNKKMACGFNDWFNGRVHTITGVACFGYTFSQEDILMDIVGSKLPHLYFGKRTPDRNGLYHWNTSPGELDPEVAYTKR